ncbi:MAG: hypothetical protein MUE96_11560 [Bacteroidia bacterium]|jgi:hypothetical protein|nr:hypothetical protein [Bacteroidia bacterium]
MKSHFCLFTLILGIYVLLVTGCLSKKIERLKEEYSIVPTTSKQIDIPKYEKPHNLAGLYYNYWHYAKQKERQLELSSLETNYVDTIFRIWITNSSGRKGQPHGLINLSKHLDSFYCQLVFMKVDFTYSGLKETITTKSVLYLDPKNISWQQLWDSLYFYKIDKIETDDLIPNYYKGNEGYNNYLPTFSFEYSVPNQYRFYQFNNYEPKVTQFWQAKNVDSILELLNREFDWNKRGSVYFR